MNVKNKRLTIVISIIALIFLNLLVVYAIDSDTDIENNVMSIQVNVEDTKELKVNFVPVDFKQTSIQDFISSSDKVGC